MINDPTVRCPVCNYYDFHLIKEQKVKNINFKILQCKICDNGFLVPLPNLDLLNEMEEDWGLESHLFESESAISHYDHLFSQYVNKIINKEDGQMLSINDKWRSFEETAKKYGWNCRVIPFKRFLNLTYSFDTDFAENDDKFDLIVFHHVFEHLTKPSEAIFLISKWLKKEGCVLITVPNMDSDLFKFQGQNWHPLKIPFHTYYYNKYGINWLMQNKVALQGVSYEVVFQSSFPPFGFSEGEGLTTIYRKIG